jgi:hypothetical protein
MKEIMEIWLDGMSADRFWAMYLTALSGILIFFLDDVRKGIVKVPGTPKHFSWRYFVKGLFRLVINIITLFFVLINYKDISEMILHAETTLNGASALVAGVSIDSVVKRLVGWSYEGKKVVSG